MAGWHHRLNGHGFGQRCLVGHSSSGCKESNTNECVAHTHIHTHILSILYIFVYLLSTKNSEVCTYNEK